MQNCSYYLQPFKNLLKTILTKKKLGNGGEGEENMSQSYHEIFDTQAYMQSHLAEKHKHDSGGVLYIYV